MCFRHCAVGDHGTEQVHASVFNAELFSTLEVDGRRGFVLSHRVCGFHFFFLPILAIL